MLCLQVRNCHLDEDSLLSRVSFYVCVPLAPEFAPNNVRVGKITIDNVELYWSPAKDADGYRVNFIFIFEL